MKKSLLVLAALALFATSPAFAAKGDKWINVGAGASIPNGDFSDVASTGWVGTIGGEFGVGAKVNLGVEFGYHSWGVKDEFKTANDLSDATFTGLQYTAFGTYSFAMSNPKNRPYLKGGLGMYDLKTKVTPTGFSEVSDSQNKFGWNAGLGFDHEVSPMYTLGIIGEYHSVQTEGTSTNFITVGAKLGWGMGKK